MLFRAERKLAELQRWVDSVGSPGDWPAAIALGFFRTRPAEGQGLVARGARAMFPHLWVHPAALGGWAVRVAPSQPSQMVIYEEVFIDGVYDLDRVAFVPDAIVDCGAFEGYFSLLARARFASAPIVAFEPNARNFAGLQANIEHNHLAVVARAEAISTHDGIARFSGDGCGGRLTGADEGGVDVAVADLRRVIAEINPQRLLLKLDIEGHEATLLPALLPVLPRCCAIFFEWHHDLDGYRRASETLTAHGFATVLTREARGGGSDVFIDAFAQRI
jgi:FkbM family methyltransferase